MVRRGLKSPAAFLSALNSLPILALVLIVVGYVPAQDNPEVKTKNIFPFVTRAEAQVLFPVFEFASLYRTGGGATFTLEYPLSPYFSPFVRAGAFYAPLNASGGLVLSEGTLGLSLGLRPAERFSLRLEGMGGLVSVASDGMSGTAYAAGARLGAGFRVHPALTIFATGGLSAYFGSTEPFYLGASAGVFASLALGELRTDTSRVKIRSLKTEAVFPVFYSYYDDNPFGSIVIANGEDTRIEDVKVSFVVGQYMDRPKVCVTIPSIAAGASVEAQLTALFNDGVLTLTEGSTVRGEVVVEYRQVGAKRSVSAPVEMRMHHRNAMNWLDDRRAAAFATPKDPASLWFSRYVSGIVRDRLRGDIDRNLQYAIGLFEAERLFGLSYVVDPASSYVEKSANEATVDYLQFPHQTLDYRGGDCDDLTILYASLLQSVGIETAFITIPGHIYMAFVLDTPEARAKQDFYDPGLLIFKEGRAWVPVEITMVKDGFVKAWRVGAKEWQDNVKTESAALFPIVAAWNIYPPVGVPDVNPNLNLPPESQIAQAFDLALDRYVARDIETKVAGLALASVGMDSVEAANELGILYARYGMLKEAWKAFSAASKGGYAPAWINLANVAYLRKDYKLAIEYYEYAGTLLPDEPSILLGIARSRYEQENFTESDMAYTRLKAVDPELASKYGYLASIFGGEGRAWSLSDRMASAYWAGQKAAQGDVQPIPIADAIPVAEPFVQSPQEEVRGPVTPPTITAVPEVEHETLTATDKATVAVTYPVVAPDIVAPVVVAPVVVAPVVVAPPVVAPPVVAPPVVAPPVEVQAIAVPPVQAIEPSKEPEFAVETVPEPAALVAVSTPIEPMVPVVAAAPPEAPVKELPVEPPPVEVPETLVAPIEVAVVEAPETVTIAQPMVVEPIVVSPVVEAPKPITVTPVVVAPVVVAPVVVAPKVVRVAPPVIADNLPDDLDIVAKKAAEAAASARLAKAQTVAVAQVVVAPVTSPVVVAPVVVAPVVVAPVVVAPVVVAPVVVTPKAIRVAPPVIADNLPDDQEIAAKKAAEAAALAQLAKAQSIAVAPVVVAPIAAPVAVAPVVVEATVEPEAAPVDVAPIAAEPIVVVPVVMAPLEIEPVVVEATVEPETALVVVEPDVVAPVEVASVIAEPTIEPEAVPEDVASIEAVSVVVEKEAVEPVPVAVAVPADEVPSGAELAEPVVAEPEAAPVIVEPVVVEPVSVAVVEIPVVVEPVVDDVEAPVLVSSLEPETISPPVVELALAKVLPAETKPAATPAPSFVPAPVPVPAEYVPNFIYEVEPVSERAIVVEGFDGMTPATGLWAIVGNTAAQLDPKQLFAKLTFPLDQGGSKISYSFKAKSTGTEWVGFGIHVFARAVRTHKGYGEGESILVWFTSDPLHGGDGSTRIQVYRSIRDSVMVSPFVETRISESLFDAHDFRIDVDPAKGSLAVSVDSSERYRLLKTPDFSAADSVALRALDKVEFSDFRVDVTR